MIGKNPYFPTHLQVQTTAACGAACSICPHPVESPNWSNGLMSEALFDRIVDQLAARDVQYISPYLMADPLSDKSIFDRIAKLRRALPEAHIEVSTTGKYLAPRLADRLLETSLSELRISSHGITADEYARTMPGVDFDKAMLNIRRFIERWKERRPYPLSVVSLWGLWSAEREAQIEAYWEGLGVELSKWRVNSRAKQVDLTVLDEASPDPTPYRNARREPPYRCRFNRDTEWMHILSDGRVTLCCMDYGQEVVLGDAGTHSLEAIWTGQAYRRARRAVRGDDSTPSGFICSRCEWSVSESVHEAATCSDTRELAHAGPPAERMTGVVESPTTRLDSI